MLLGGSTGAGNTAAASKSWELASIHVNDAGVRMYFYTSRPFLQQQEPTSGKTLDLDQLYLQQ